MDKIEIKVDRMVGCTDGYELYTEKGKTTITFKEMAQYHGDVLPKGDNIQITLKDDNRAELAIGRMVLVVPEAFLLEKGLICPFRILQTKGLFQQRPFAFIYTVSAKAEHLPCEI